MIFALFMNNFPNSILTADVTIRPPVFNECQYQSNTKNNTNTNTDTDINTDINTNTDTNTNNQHLETRYFDCGCARCDDATSTELGSYTSAMLCQVMANVFVVIGFQILLAYGQYLITKIRRTFFSGM